MPHTNSFGEALTPKGGYWEVGSPGSHRFRRSNGSGAPVKGLVSLEEKEELDLSLCLFH